jgi:hypothetical protein
VVHYLDASGAQLSRHTTDSDDSEEIEEVDKVPQAQIPLRRPTGVDSGTPYFRRASSSLGKYGECECTAVEPVRQMWCSLVSGRCKG